MIDMKMNPSRLNGRLSMIRIDLRCNEYKIYNSIIHYFGSHCVRQFALGTIYFSTN